MTPEAFFEIFERELGQNKALTDYHRLVNSSSRYPFRKAYMQQRLHYVSKAITGPGKRIWDVGCGFGTTAIFFALNGFEVHGSTLEFYFEEIDNRLAFWKEYGDLSKLDIRYENIFDMDVPVGTYDYVLAQDTLHHLEPFDQAAIILRDALKDNGKLVASEENGNNIFNNLKNFRRRGFKRVKSMYDEKLDKDILIGDENTRSLKAWQAEFEKVGMQIDPGSVEYIRYYFPHKYRRASIEEIVAQERKMASRAGFKREYFFFGLNYTVSKRR